MNGIKWRTGETILCLPLALSVEQKTNTRVSQILHFVPTASTICAVKLNTQIQNASNSESSEPFRIYDSEPSVPIILQINEPSAGNI
jgi:hypothetical protein